MVVDNMAESANMAASPKSSRFDLPGLNKPLNWIPNVLNGLYHNDLFSTALDAEEVREEFASFPLTTLREFTMLQIKDAITDKPDWETKVFDDDIASKWKMEVVSDQGRDVTQRMVDWVIDELRWQAEAFSKSRIMIAYDSGVVKSDSRVTTATKISLVEAVSALEHSFDGRRDYHPGSDEKVVDLVHPSLFPLVYGKTRVLERSLVGFTNPIESCGKGSVVQMRPEAETASESSESTLARILWERRGPYTSPYSRHFQWLPSEVKFDKEGKAKFTSYINNLHPFKHGDLYSAIEQVIDEAIPLLNITLGCSRDKSQSSPRIPYTRAVYDPDPEKITRNEWPPQEANENEFAYNDRIDAWLESIRRTVLPEPETFTPRNDPAPVILTEEYAKDGLQVIVKLANIELSPEKPDYQGGSWHVEGQLNEHICATALYYYDSENITSSRLVFRQQTTDGDMALMHPQDEYTFLRDVFGCEQYGPTVQEIGSVLCPEGRLLTFPNVLQHRVEPFRLADPTRKGHRKILAFFLVDPGLKIISTANVPPQQKDWWTESVRNALANDDKGLGMLSNELQDMVFDGVDTFLSMHDAQEIRLKLMEERGRQVRAQGVLFESNQFNLCEH